MRFLVPLLVLLSLYQATADNCSFIITQRSGSLPSSANPSCSTVVYHFENPLEESYWSLLFTSFQPGNDLFTFYDGPDTFSPAIVTSPADKLNTQETFMSTTGWLTLQIARMTLDDVPSTWTAQYINWEQNNTVTDANGYSVYMSDDSYTFDLLQDVNGRAHDYIGSVWVISPNPEWSSSQGIAVNFELEDLVDTTGTLQVTVQYNGHVAIIFDAADVGNSQGWYFIPSSNYGAKVIIRSQVRTYAGSYSSFKLNAYEGVSWESESSSNSHPVPAIIVIAVGSLLGIGLIIGISVIVKKCYNRKKLIVQYQQLAMSDSQAVQTPRYPQPMYVMMSPPPHPIAPPMNQV